MIFGTDGIRGLVNTDITTELAYNVGKSMAMLIKQRKLTKKVVIGKDTRISGDAFVYAVASALSDNGIDVVIVGVVPTPAISFLVGTKDYGGGIMITASHNDYHYNGIKIFDNNGFKINKSTESEIENNLYLPRKVLLRKGKIEYNESEIDCYIQNLLRFFNNNLEGLKIVVDCSNGSNVRIAPNLFKTLGAKVIKIGCSQNGLKINRNCGAGNISRIVEKVKSVNADYGVAFDGDGDRLVIVLSDGRVLSGDELLLYYSLYLKNKNNLNNLSVVGTILTSRFVEEYLNSYNIKLLRSEVGDRNVIQMIKENNLNIGGEDSGHICIINYEHSCDAMLNALFFFNCVKENKELLNKIINTKNSYVISTKNILVSPNEKDKILLDTKILDNIKKIKEKYNMAKIVIRPSGTEPYIRILVESKNNNLNELIINKISMILKEESIN